MGDPDRLYIDKDDRAIYKKLKEIGIFKDLQDKDQFMFAMGYGIRYKQKIPLKSRENFFLVDRFKDGDIVLLNSLAIFENRNANEPIEILKDKAEIYKIAEEYAHGGILLIEGSSNTQIESFWKFLEKDLDEIFVKKIINKESKSNE